MTTDRVLALDLATVTGWAYRQPDGITSGHYELGQDIADGPTRSPEPYWSDLEWLIDSMSPHVIVIEKGFHRGATSTFLGGLVYTARMAAFRRGARFALCPPARWRKAARDIASEAGIAIAPKAGKEAYHAAAYQLWGIGQGDEADARWLLAWYDRCVVALPTG